MRRPRVALVYLFPPLLAHPVRMFVAALITHLAAGVAIIWFLLDDTLPSDPSDWFSYLGKLSTGTLLALIAIGFWKEWIVSGPLYRSVKAERDNLRAASDKLLEAYQAREREEALWRRDRALRLETAGDHKPEAVGGTP